MLVSICLALGIVMTCAALTDYIDYVAKDSISRFKAWAYGIYYLTILSILITTFMNVLIF